VAAQKTGVLVLFTCALSNHHHTGIWDIHGNFPAFIEYFHRLFAKCQNALRGRWENFWSSEQTSAVLLVEPHDIMEEMVYALSNPAKDHLVERSCQWPGASSLAAIVEGKSLVATRPKHFFRNEGPMPPVARLTFARPPGFECDSLGDFSKRLLQGIGAVESKAAAERRQSGRRVLGVKGVLAQDWHARPRSSELRMAPHPRVAAKNKWARVEALVRNKGFIELYASARKLMLQGIEVLFPAGTYWLARFAHVLCEPIPTG
jgi:putative transposase